MTRNHLLLIDPQNDFMDIPGAALPVAGAAADMARLAGFIDAAGSRLAQLFVTLDSHHSVGIERPGFWRQGDGAAVQPFTAIRADDVRAARYLPRDLAALPRVLAYLDALEAGGRYTLMVWPVHCEIGTWGHNVYAPVRDAYVRWEAAALTPVRKVLKGLNPWTENYSALQAEVPLADDPLTQLNTALVAELDAGDRIFIAGEASSHCVRATTEHLLGHLPSADAGKIVLLADCMSPVPGFEAQGQAFLQAMRERGTVVTTAAEALNRLA